MHEQKIVKEKISDHCYGSICFRCLKVVCVCVPDIVYVMGPNVLKKIVIPVHFDLVVKKMFCSPLGKHLINKIKKHKYKNIYIYIQMPVVLCDG